jgi:hypothetical protein
MSHHLDSPLARQDVRLDITDLYVFRGQSGTVLAINLCHSLAAADTPVPGYHPEGMYEFKIDLNRDAIEDITYRFVFGERDRDGIQSVELRELTGSAAADPRAAGVVVAHGSTGQTLNSPDGVRVWTGQAGDPFWIEPDVLHAVGHAFQDGTTIDLTDWTPDQATNLFAGHTVYSIVLEVPDDKLLSTGGDGRIGAWAVSSLQTDAGGWRSPSTTRTSATGSMPARPPRTSRPTARRSSARSPASSPPTGPPRIRVHTPSGSRTAFCPTCFPIGWAPRPRSGSSSGTGAR